MSEEIIYRPDGSANLDKATNNFLNKQEKFSSNESNESSNENSISRRDFIIGGFALLAGAAIAKPAFYKLKEFGEKKLEEKIEQLLSGEIADVIVPKGYGIDHFYARSGWNEGEGSVDSFTYREATMKLNDMKDVTLQENQTLKVPIREGQSLQGGE